MCVCAAGGSGPPAGLVGSTCHGASVPWQVFREGGPVAKDVIVVLQSAYKQSSFAMRTAPLDVITAMSLCSRLSLSLTPAKIEPATRERLDHYPEMHDTVSVKDWLLQRQPVIRLDLKQIREAAEFHN